MKETNMNVWMTFDEAWETFYSLPQRKSRPTEGEKNVAREVCEDLMAVKFAIRPDEKIIYSEEHVVHINPGFVSTKGEARHVVRSEKYPGFSHQYEFTNFEAQATPNSVGKSDGKVLCDESSVWVNPGAECGFCGEVHPAEG